MEEIRLIRPSKEYGEDIMQFRKEIIEANDSDSFAGCGSLRGCEAAEEWLEILDKMRNIDTCPKGECSFRYLYCCPHIR